jgi:protein-tyrosine phosphatase
VMRMTRRFGVYLIALIVCSAFCVSAQGRADTTHAVAQKVPVRGVPNFGQVTPNLYRGAQPSDKGFESLAKMGVNVVVDLREGNEGNFEEKIVTKNGMTFVGIPWRCTTPKDDYFAKFLTVLRDNSDKKVFVHCHVGVDRTGMMIAAYRISEQGWSADEALREMRAFGFNSFHQFMCYGLESYEQRFPAVVSSSPAFQTLRSTSGQKPTTPPVPAGPQP